MWDRRSAILALGVFAAAAVLATWPLVLTPGRAIAGGPGDPMLTIAILAWDADRLAHGLRGFWDAPWLFPHRHSLAYSEHFLGVALFTAPIQWMTGNPILAYNAAYVGSYVLAGFGMFLLARALWGRVDAAILAGLAFELTPYRLAQSSHLQMLINGWMPIGLLALHGYLAGGSRRWLAAFSAVFVVLGLSNGYYLYFFLLPVAVIVGAELTRRCSPVPRRRIVVDLAAAGLAIAAALAPVMFVYYRLQREHGFTRAIDDLPRLSARFADYLHVAAGAWRWGGLLPIGTGERELFHGFVVLAFAAIGAVTIRDRGRTRLVATYLLMAVLAVWLAMGPGPGKPYGLLFKLLPGFSAMRVPARLSAIVILALAALAGAGFASVLGRLPKRAAAAASIVIAATLLLEGHGVGLAATPALKSRNWDTVAYEWLRASPPGAVLELDVTQLDDFKPFTPLYQLRALAHRHPIVNGYAGWKSTLQELLGSYASPLRETGHAAEVLRGLRAIGVRYILLHERTFASPEDARRQVSEIRAAGDQIAEEHEWPGTWAWRLTAAHAAPALVDEGLTPLDPATFVVHASGHENRLPLLFDGDIDTRWISGDPQDGGEWIEIRFPRPVDVGRVRLDTESRSVMDYPRLLVIDSADDARAARNLFTGGVADRLITSLAVDERHAPIVIDLPRNRTVTLRIGQGARGMTWWSIHELRLWERRTVNVEKRQ